MAMRIVDRLAGGKKSEAKSELSDVVGHFHKLVLDRVDHKALASLSPEETSDHLKREIVRLIDTDARAFTRQEQAEIVSTIMDEIMGLGPLEGLLADPAVSKYGSGSNPLSFKN